MELERRVAPRQRAKENKVRRTRSAVKEGRVSERVLGDFPEYTGNKGYTYGQGVTIKPSEMQGASGENRGLFVTVPVRAHGFITEYTGRRITRQEALTLRRQGLATHIKSLNFDFLIDGNKNPRLGQGIAQLANDATMLGKNNSYFCQIYDEKVGGERVFLKALRELGEGEEVFVCYGSRFWKTELSGGKVEYREMDPESERRLLEIERLEDEKWEEQERQHKEFVRKRAEERKRQRRKAAEELRLKEEAEQAAKKAAREEARRKIREENLKIRLEKREALRQEREEQKRQVREQKLREREKEKEQKRLQVEEEDRLMGSGCSSVREIPGKDGDSLEGSKVCTSMSTYEKGKKSISPLERYMARTSRNGRLPKFREFLLGLLPTVKEAEILDTGSVWNFWAAKKALSKIEKRHPPKTVSIFECFEFLLHTSHIESKDMLESFTTILEFPLDIQFMGPTNFPTEKRLTIVAGLLRFSFSNIVLLQNRLMTHVARMYEQNLGVLKADKVGERECLEYVSFLAKQGLDCSPLFPLFSGDLDGGACLRVVTKHTKKNTEKFAAAMQSANSLPLDVQLVVVEYLWGWEELNKQMHARGKNQQALKRLGEQEFLRTMSKMADAAGKALDRSC